MTLSIRPIDAVSRPFFAGEVSGIDITRPLTQDQAVQIEAGMDQYGVLVFHDQHRALAWNFIVGRFGKIVSGNVHAITLFSTLNSF